MICPVCGKDEREEGRLVCDGCSDRALKASREANILHSKNNARRKVTFRVCASCRKGDCDCAQYDGLDQREMPEGYFPHDNSKHNHWCHCYFDVEGSCLSELRKLNKALYELKMCFCKEILNVTIVPIKKVCDYFKKKRGRD